MDQRVKGLWVEALRSGKFKQGRSKLKHAGEYGSNHCCLGVLCEVHDADKSCEKSFNDIEGFPPDHICQWAGLGDPAEISFKFTNDFGETFKESIVYLNDIRGYNFHQLADLIEAQL